MRTLALALLFAGAAAAQPDGRMAPGSGSGTAPGTGATTPGYGSAAPGNQPNKPTSGSTGRDGEEPRGSIGAGKMEPGGSAASTSIGTTVPPPVR